MAFYTPLKNGGNLLKQLEDEGKVGIYTTKYISESPSLMGLLSETTHFSTVATLYYNITLKANDPVFSVSTFGISKATVDKKFSLSKYHTKYSKDKNFSKQNLHDVILSTFQSNSQRLYHDIQYDYKRKRMMSVPLT